MTNEPLEYPEYLNNSMKWITKLAGDHVENLVHTVKEQEKEIARLKDALNKLQDKSIRMR